MGSVCYDSRPLTINRRVIWPCNLMQVMLRFCVRVEQSYNITWMIKVMWGYATNRSAITSVRLLTISDLAECEWVHFPWQGGGASRRPLFFEWGVVLFNDRISHLLTPWWIKIWGKNWWCFPCHNSCLWRKYFCFISDLGGSKEAPEMWEYCQCATMLNQQYSDFSRTFIM